MKRYAWSVVLPILILCFASSGANGQSGSPLRTVPPPVMRPLADSGVVYVDSIQGDDGHDGSAGRPLQSVAAALAIVRPGGTVCLRGGTYYDNVYVAVCGKEDAPITIRAYPGERVVIDGGIRDFFQSPDKAWQPAPGGAEGEYQSTATFRNMHQPIGSFGDSMIGLQTYYHVIDLRAERQLIHYDDFSKRREVDYDPIYCGPGMWIDPDAGRIHIRLAHTTVEGIATNYTGETDPRKLPMVIASFGSVPLTVEGARHVIFQDLVIRGAGYDCVKLNLASHVTFDNVVIWAGTYGIRARATQHLRIVNCGVYGNAAPWTFRSDTSKRDYPGKPTRNITRLNTHALLVTDNGREHAVYASPVNDHWDIGYSAWTDAHDGLYLGGINVKFHHNLVENMQDDGIYVSQVYPRHLFARSWPTIHIGQNVFRQVNMPIAHGAGYVSQENESVVYIYRNVFDQRRPLNYGRPTTEKSDVRFWTGLVMADHGSPPWAAMNIYHNTMISGARQRHAHMSTINAPHPDRPRRVFNNIFFHIASMPNYPKIDPEKNVHADANLFWSPGLDEKQQAGFFARFRRSPQYEQSKAVYEPGFGSNALVADPMFVKMEADGTIINDYRLQRDSTAINAGITIPADWPDPLRDADADGPDIGALPLGATMFHVGPRGKE